MKKIIFLAFFLIMSWSFATVKLQVQGSTLGTGYGLGLGTNVVPLIMDIGFEGMMYSSPQINSKGTYKDESTGILVPYEGKIDLKTTRAGGYIALHFPGLSLVPIIGIISNPVLHFGTQHIKINVEGNVRLADNGNAIDENLVGQGSYFLVGFPTYIGPLLIEPAIGSQHIFVDGFANYKNTPEAQLAVGLSF